MVFRYSMFPFSGLKLKSPEVSKSEIVDFQVEIHRIHYNLQISLESIDFNEISGIFQTKDQQ